MPTISIDVTDAQAARIKAALGPDMTNAELAELLRRAARQAWVDAVLERERMLRLGAFIDRQAAEEARAKVDLGLPPNPVAPTPTPEV